jgi:hypothetical protein
VKNRYAVNAEVVDGYRDLGVHVLYRGSNDLNIIGEIQLHVKEFWCLKTQVLPLSLSLAHSRDSSHSLANAHMMCVCVCV